jgi:hypothetical protein
MVVIVECSFCHVADDDWRHSLLYCAMTRGVWALIHGIFVGHISINQCEVLRSGSSF